MLRDQQSVTQLEAYEAELQQQLERARRGIALVDRTLRRNFLD